MDDKELPIETQLHCLEINILYLEFSGQSFNSKIKDECKYFLICN